MTDKGIFHLNKQVLVFSKIWKKLQTMDFANYVVVVSLKGEAISDSSLYPIHLAQALRHGT